MSVLNAVVGIIPLAFVVGFLIGFMMDDPTMQNIKEPAKNGVRAGFFAIVVVEAVILSVVFFEWVVGIG